MKNDTNKIHKTIEVVKSDLDDFKLDIKNRYNELRIQNENDVVPKFSVSILDSDKKDMVATTIKNDNGVIEHYKDMNEKLNSDSFGKMTKRQQMLTINQERVKLIKKIRDSHFLKQKLISKKINELDKSYMLKPITGDYIKNKQNEMILSFENETKSNKNDAYQHFGYEETHLDMIETQPLSITEIKGIYDGLTLFNKTQFDVANENQKIEERYIDLLEVKPISSEEMKLIIKNINNFNHEKDFLENNKNKIIEVKIDLLETTPITSLEMREIILNINKLNRETKVDHKREQVQKETDNLVQNYYFEERKDIKITKDFLDNLKNSKKQLGNGFGLIDAGENNQYSYIKNTDEDMWITNDDFENTENNLEKKESSKPLSDSDFLNLIVKK